MKKFINILLIAPFVLLFNSGYAQCGTTTPCTPNPSCPAGSSSVPFSPIQTITVQVPPGTANCVLEISYASRKDECCPGLCLNDYFLAGVEVIQSSGCSFNVNDILEVVNAATIALRLDNPSNFYTPTQEGECISDNRIVNAMCFEKNGPCFEPCVSVCVATDIIICFENGELVITKNPDWNPPPNIQCDIPCEPVVSGEL